MNKIYSVNDVTLPGIVKNNEYFLLQCSAHWCGICAQGQDLMEKFLLHYEIPVGVIDLPESPKTMTKIKPDGIPYYVLFKDGEIEATITGNKNLIEEFAEFID